MEVWDHALDSGAFPELTQEQKDELDRRISDLDANPDDVYTWEETKQFLRRSK
jgi:putative addiction module component (TIGR02574 family)